MNTVQTVWPPKESECDRVGFKSEHTVLRDHITLSLKGLSVHKFAWWYGCRISSEKACRLRVGLRKANGERLMGDDWTQTTGEWCPLPWLLPGALTDCEDAYMDIQVVESGSAGLDYDSSSFFVVTAAYVELPSVHPMDRFLFVGEDGAPVAHWNRFRKEFGTPTAGVAPTWQTLHTVVPPLRSLLRDVWDRSAVFCIHAWDEHVPHLIM